MFFLLISYNNYWNMEIEFLSDANRQEWDDFAANSSSAWFRHTTAWQKYSSCCRFDSNTRNLSFMVKQSNRIQAIVPLLAEYSYPEMDFDCFAMYGDYTPLPAYSDDETVSRTLVTEAMVKTLDELAARYGIRYGKFVIDPLISYPYFTDFAPYNLLTAKAALHFTTTNIVDLRYDLDVVLRRMRKGHKAAVKQVLNEKGCRVDVFDSNNVTKEHLLRFKYIHRQDAGRQTRTDASWDCMYEWIRDGNACLAMLWLDSIQDYGAAALVMMYKKSAYYASYGTLDSTYLNGHCGHIIQWSIISYLKSAGIEKYEMGENYFDLPDTEAGHKLNEIAKYKRGFRSVEIPKITYRTEYSLSSHAG